MSKKIVKYDFNFKYKDEDFPALSDVKGDIEQGKCIVLCGSSGCGKSTFLRCINHLIPQFYEGELKGFCFLNGQDTKKLSIGEIGEYAASVFQDPRSQFFTTDSSAEVAFGLENFGFEHDEIVRRVDHVYKESALEKLKGRNVFELSSGERQMIAILSAKALDAQIFLLDEPTANLDFSAINQLSSLLKTLKEQGKTLIINEHRLYYLKDIADEYILMDEGKVVQRFTADEMNQFSEKELAEKKLRITDIEKINQTTPKNVQSARTDILKADNICFSYKKRGDQILSGVSMTAKTGDVIGLIGSNGSGKTTFGKLAAGLLKPTDGQFIFNGEAISHKQLLENSIFIMQEAEFQLFSNTVMNELTYKKEVTPELMAEIERLLKEFGIWHCRNRHPFSLSGGQMQKLVILLAYFSKKPIVILDEPTAGLDKKSLQSCIKIIEEMRQKKMVFVITHDLELISQICTECIYISKGKNVRGFNLFQRENFGDLVQCMQKNFSVFDNQRPLTQKRKKTLCDFRVKLLYLIAALFITATSQAYIIATTLTAELILTLYERRFKTAFISGGIAGLLYLLYFLFPQSIMGFLVHYFPRFILLWLALAAVAENGESARVTASLRWIRIPENIIMICTVVLRFFPVLSNDLKIMEQSIKTRGIFVNVTEKIKFFPQYCEMIIMPMIFRVIRIAEMLAASAQTRGIDLKRKRQSYITLHFNVMDIIMVILLAMLVALGILLK